DEKKLSEIESELNKYAGATNQVNIIPPTQLESSAAAEQHATGPDVTGPDATGPNATGPDAAEQYATEQNATEQNTTEQNVVKPDVTVNTLNPGATHANAEDGPSKHGKMKIERPNESKMSTTRLVDDKLNMAWDVNVNDTHVESSLQNLDKEAFGHIMRNSQARYCVRYGSADARSARFESTLPAGSRYQETRDVTQRSNRIVERIVQFHRDSKTALPMNILSKVKILLVYWDSKRGVGYEAEVDVLAPDFPERRPHTRCFIYLDPALYAKYGLVNDTGYSHETRSTMKLLMEGNDDRQKSITLHNIAVRLENDFERMWMSGVPDRPEPLRELAHERKMVSRRTRSPHATAEPSASPPLVKPPISIRQPTTLPKTLHEQAPTGKKPGMSLKQRFHMDFLELFDLAENVTYYFLFGNRIMAFPPGFKMIAGDAGKRNAFVPTLDIPQSLWGPDEKSPKALAEKAIGFNCLNYSGSAEGALTRHMLPNKSFIDSNCADGLRLELMFPSCWNGISLDADDHKSHVAYPDLVMEGACPADHETRIPALFFETIWNTSVFRNSSGHFLLSNGDQTAGNWQLHKFIGPDRRLLHLFFAAPISSRPMYSTTASRSCQRKLSWTSVRSLR
ncbi:hypothetical protein T440DRAFT_411105, partial [Plenodomus tracheiphilus IPT5]